MLQVNSFFTGTALELKQRKILGALSQICNNLYYSFIYIIFIEKIWIPYWKEIVYLFTTWMAYTNTKSILRKYANI